MCQAPGAEMSEGRAGRRAVIAGAIAALIGGEAWAKKRRKRRKRRSGVATPAKDRDVADPDEGCSCRSGKVCIGPRGGRYCITSGGNKRYGV